MENWIQTLSIITTIVACAYYIQSDLRRKRDEIKAQSARTDRLYEVFIDLIKENKK